MTRRDDRAIAYRDQLIEDWGRRLATAYMLHDRRGREIEKQEACAPDVVRSRRAECRICECDNALMRSLGPRRHAIRQRLRPLSMTELAPTIQQQQTRFIGVLANPCQSAQGGVQRFPVLERQFHFALEIGFDA